MYAGSLGRRRVGHDAAVRLHDQQRRRDARRVELAAQRCEVARDQSAARRR